MQEEKRTLTKAEEQIMQVLWKNGASFLKDVVDAMAKPAPHSNTVATLLKILIDKGFVTAETLGRNHCYRATITRTAYSNQSLGKVVSSYFDGSYKSAVSFLVDQQKISVEDLELLLHQLKKTTQP